MDINSHFISECNSAIERVEKLFKTEILSTCEPDVFYNSVLIEVLINLKDILVKCKKIGHKVDFKDDVIPDNKLNIQDVTDLISNFRDACCHNDSYRRRKNNITSSFNRIQGKGILFRINDIEIGSKYDDDIAFIMGSNVLYLKRHIYRSFISARNILEPYLY